MAPRRSDVSQVYAAFRKLPAHGIQVPGIVSPPPRSAAVQRLPDLPVACGLYRTPPSMEIEAVLVPGQAKEGQQPAQGGLRITHERVVIEVDDAVAVYVLPVRHQALVLAVVVADVSQFTGIRGNLWLQMMAEHRQAGVERMAQGVDDPCPGEQSLDQADQQEVVGPLVGDVGALDSFRSEERRVGK